MDQPIGQGASHIPTPLAANMNIQAQVGRKSYAPRGQKPFVHEARNRDEVREQLQNQPNRAPHEVPKEAVAVPHREQLQVNAAYNCRPTVIKPPIYIRNDRKEDWHRQNAERPGRVKNKPPANRSRHGRKFDSTRGYPGEGPAYAFCETSELGRYCTKASHFHKKMSKSGAAKRLAEKKQERKEPRYDLCKVKGCDDPWHYHPVNTGKGPKLRPPLKHAGKAADILSGLDTEQPALDWTDDQEAKDDVWYRFKCTPPLSPRPAVVAAPSTHSNASGVPTVSDGGEGDFSDDVVVSPPPTPKNEGKYPEDVRLPGEAQQNEFDVPDAATLRLWDQGLHHYDVDEILDQHRLRARIARWKALTPPAFMCGKCGKGFDRRVDLDSHSHDVPQLPPLPPPAQPIAPVPVIAPAPPPIPFIPGVVEVDAPAPKPPAHPNFLIGPLVPTHVAKVFVHLDDWRSNDWESELSKARKKGLDLLFWLRSLFHETVTTTTVFHLLEGDAVKPTEQTAVRHCWSRKVQTKSENGARFFRIIGKYYNSMHDALVYTDIANACLNDTDTLFKRNVLKADGTPYSTLEGVIKDYIKRNGLYDNQLHEQSILSNTISHVGCMMIIRAAFIQKSFVTGLQPRQRPENESAAPFPSRSRIGGRTGDP